MIVVVCFFVSMFILSMFTLWLSDFILHRYDVDMDIMLWPLVVAVYVLAWLSYFLACYFVH